MTTLAQRLATVQDRVHRACERAGRDPATVQLIAVSKTRPPEELIEAAAAGQLHFGENYAQELRDKGAALDGRLPPGVVWHFIGHLQSNKVKYVVPRAALVHTVDSARLAAELGRRALPGAPQGLLVQVNVGDETSKSGVSVAEALDVCAEVMAAPNVALRGLMTIPPAVDRPEQAAPYFDALAALAAEGRARGLPLNELSMGMSHDFEEAILRGATLVRVGTAIFGERVRPA